MPRKSRIDAPGALHHIIARGIERTDIFTDDSDHHHFIDRFGIILHETHTSCFAWALIPNHFHLLLKTGQVPIATVMRRLMTGYAITFNRRHRRSGHLFQNRYKSILCQEDNYLLELVRYIHLNPLRAKMVADIKVLNKYPFCGHSVIMGKVKNTWQDIKGVLRLFDERAGVARRSYRAFVQKGISKGKRKDLTGGGLIRSGGGWTAVKAMRRAQIFQKADERILGNGDFVEQVLSENKEMMEQKYAILANGMDVDKIAQRVGELMEVDVSAMMAKGKEPWRVKARSLLCYWAVRDVGITMAELSRRLKISLSGVALSVLRGEKIAQDYGYALIDHQTGKLKNVP